MKKIEKLRKDVKELMEEIERSTNRADVISDLLPNSEEKLKAMDDLMKDLQISSAIFYLEKIAEHTAYIADALDKMNEPPYRTLNRNSEFSAGTILGDADIQKMFKKEDEEREIKIGELKVGDTFVEPGDIGIAYMIVDVGKFNFPEFSDEGYIPAVCLNSAILLFYSPKTVVFPVSCTLDWEDCIIRKYRPIEEGIRV